MTTQAGCVHNSVVTSGQFEDRYSGIWTTAYGFKTAIAQSP